MTILERFGLPAVTGAPVYGEPRELADGSVVITATRTGLRGEPKPVGIFVIHGGKVTWEPAVDVDRVAFLGVLTGLLAAAFATLAMLRRPPWPDVTIRKS
jgi:hypothetical protein